MIAAWIASAVVIALCCALAATVAEWTVSLRRGLPVRWVWAMAMLTAALLPVFGALRSEAMFGSIPVSIAPAALTPTNVESSRAAGVPIAPTPNGFAIAVTAAWRDVRSAVASLPPVSQEMALGFAVSWSGASLLLLLGMGWTSLRLRRDRRHWRSQVLYGVPVLLSDGLGPALVGFAHPQIVIPPWVLTLDDASLRTIVAHEDAHRRAGDSRLIIAASVMAMLVPWNAPLWWMLRRLVRAVEFDCDARVVAQGANAARYAALLLGAWEHAQETRGLALSAALVERGSRLGRRVTHMLRPAPRGMLMKSLTGVSAVVLFSVLAVAVPTPQLAQGAAASAPASSQPYGHRPWW